MRGRTRPKHHFYMSPSFLERTVGMIAGAGALLEPVRRSVVGAADLRDQDKSVSVPESISSIKVVGFTTL